MNSNSKNSQSSETATDNKGYELLMLDNQLCFSLYVCSKEIIKKYKTLLDPYGLTYTGYIIMLALWEKDNITVKDLGKRLFLDSGTLTPMLKKLEAQDYIKRIRSSSDERNVFILLSNKGRDLKIEAIKIPESLICTLDLDPQYAIELLKGLHQMMHTLESTDNSAID